MLLWYTLLVLDTSVHGVVHLVTAERNEIAVTSGWNWFPAPGQREGSELTVKPLLLPPFERSQLKSFGHLIKVPSRHHRTCPTGRGPRALDVQITVTRSSRQIKWYVLQQKQRKSISKSSSQRVKKLYKLKIAKTFFLFRLRQFVDKLVFGNASWVKFHDICFHT